MVIGLLHPQVEGQETSCCRPRAVHNTNPCRIWDETFQCHQNTMAKLSPDFGHVPIEYQTASSGSKTTILRPCWQVHVSCQLYTTGHIIHCPQTGQIHVQLWCKTL